MSVQIAFYGASDSWTLDENYEAFRERLGVHRESNEPLEVALSAGMYGRLGSRMLMTIDPRAVAWFRDLDAVVA